MQSFSAGVRDEKWLSYGTFRNHHPSSSITPFSLHCVGTGVLSYLIADVAVFIVPFYLLQISAGSHQSESILNIFEVDLKCSTQTFQFFFNFSHNISFIASHLWAVLEPMSLCLACGVEIIRSRRHAGVYSLARNRQVRDSLCEDWMATE